MVIIPTTVVKSVVGVSVSVELFGSYNVAFSSRDYVKTHGTQQSLCPIAIGYCFWCTAIANINRT
jgi:hypothetical protein